MTARELKSIIAGILDGCEDAESKTRLLCRGLSPEKQPCAAEVKKLMKSARRVAAGEPIQYVLGSWCFMDVELSVGRGVLIPRDDTVCVAETAIEHIKRFPGTVLDLCSGSGAIAIAIRTHCTNVDVIALEKSRRAYRYLKKNITDNHVSVSAVRADVFGYEKLLADRSLSLIVCNPPYVAPEEYPTLQREVLREPRMALVGQNDGRAFYEYIVPNYKAKLMTGGMICFECASRQVDWLEGFMKSAGYVSVGVLTDIGGCRRGVCGVIG